MYVKRQKFMVLGASKSGCSTAKYLILKGAVCYVYEELKSQKIEESIKELSELGAIIVSPQEIERVLNQIDVVIISPGVPINHEVAVKAKGMGKRIVGELEFGFYHFVPPIVAVTGTNGKTTTVSLIDAILKESNIKSQLVGNVGIPVTSKVNEIDLETVCVAEVSSFQLESVYAFCPHVSCVLNIAPDHLERHYSMDNYLFLKKRIFKNQRESEYTVLNFDDEIVKSFFSETRGKVIWVSLKERVDGAYRENGKLYYKNEYITDESDIRLRGDHNVLDSLFAIATSKLMGADNQSIATALKNFKGVRHRVEFVCEKNGVKYYNDSKATNTASTMVALNELREPTVLILGGSEKGEKYTELFEKIKVSPIKHTILTGASRYNMLSSASETGVTDLTVTADFFVAIKIAKMLAKNGDNVLLSPACASFDNFNNFEERGDAFIKAVGELD